MKNYKQTASDVLRLVGGEKNVVQVEHCSTACASLWQTPPRWMLQP